MLGSLEGCVQARNPRRVTVSEGNLPDGVFGQVCRAVCEPP